jgi:hypothetical protein
MLNVCEVDRTTGLVVTAADGGVALWRSAAAMAAHGEGALLGRFDSPASVNYAWILPPPHLGAWPAQPKTLGRPTPRVCERFATLTCLA